MTLKSFDKWLGNLKKAWVGKNPEIIASICDTKVKYFEEPFEKPLNYKQVLEEWNKVPKTQKNIHFDYEILSVNKDFGIAKWEASYTSINGNKKVYLKGIFQVYLDEKGRCIEFYQWYNIK